MTSPKYVAGAPLSRADAETELAALGSPEDALFLQRFFKTRPGEHGEGDRFPGIRGICT